MTGRSITALPKAHLHLHFTGSMRPATLLRFQRLYDIARSCVRDESDVRRLVLEAAEDDARDGSRWLELQVDPTSYAVHLGGLTPTLELIQDAARNASAATGVGIYESA